MSNFTRFTAETRIWVLHFLMSAGLKICQMCRYDYHAVLTCIISTFLRYYLVVYIQIENGHSSILQSKHFFSGPNRQLISNAEMKLNLFFSYGATNFSNI